MRCPAVLHRPCAMVLVLLQAIGVGACSSANLPQLPSGSAPVETGAVAVGPAEATPYETTSIVRGTPTEAYALVAGGALRCWLGPDGRPWGRVVDVAELPDGSLLVSDDFAGLVYRITYAGG